MEVQKKKRGPLPKLTPMQAKFAEALVFFEGRRYAYEAAVEAGYTKDRARQFYYDQKIILTGKLDELSEEELDIRIKTIKEDNAVLLEVDPEEKPEDIKPKLPLV